MKILSSKYINIILSFSMKALAQMRIKKHHLNPKGMTRKQ